MPCSLRGGTEFPSKANTTGDADITQNAAMVLADSRVLVVGHGLFVSGDASDYGINGNGSAAVNESRRAE